MANWRWAAASCRGAAHAAADERRQDAFRLTSPWPEVALLAITACDGAGSAVQGRQGAAITAWTLTACARAWLIGHGCLPDAAHVDRWLTLARLRIALVATRRGLRIQDYATTLVMAISDGGSTLTAHVGDGAIVGRDADTRIWLPLSWPEHGEFASTTFFVTDEGVPRLRVARHETGIDGLAVMTDGIERLALDFQTAAPHPAFLDAMLAPVTASRGVGRDERLSRKLGEYLESEQVAERTDDDKTLVMASFR